MVTVEARHQLINRGYPGILMLKTYKSLAEGVAYLMVEYEKDLKRILIWLLGGSRGGLMRLRILLLLRKKPMNPHQLAKALNVNYRTVIYHLELLERYELVSRLDVGYGAPYFISDKLEKRWDLIREVMRIMGVDEREEVVGDES